MATTTKKITPMANVIREITCSALPFGSRKSNNPETKTMKNPKRTAA